MTTQLENDYDKLETWFKCEYGDLENDDGEEEEEVEEKDDSGEE